MGKIKINIEDRDCGDTINNGVHLFIPSEFKFSVDCTDLKLWTDRARLSKKLANLKKYNG